MDLSLDKYFLIIIYMSFELKLIVSRPRYNDLLIVS